MTDAQTFFIPAEETLDADALRRLQLRKLSDMLGEVLARNSFYGEKFIGVRFNPLSDPIDVLPFTTRAELERDHSAHPPFGTNLTYPLDRYRRFHQTSGTGGHPMRWLDTAESWGWFQKVWGIIFTAAGVTASDRILFAFSFGPFVGFWGAFEGASAVGALTLPGGGLSTSARLRMCLDNGATVVCCTPTYALHMAETAEREGIDLRGSAVRTIIVAGEPGGSIPATKQRIEHAWGARMIDHTGMTEMGPVSFECLPCPGGVHIIESEFIAEVIEPATGATLPDGATGELVLTNLGRWGSPLIRYRTGDQVRLTRGDRCACGRTYARLEGGILGRVDEMFIVRGNNVFPNAIEAVLRRFDDLAEFRCTIDERGALTQVKVEIEPTPTCRAVEALVAHASAELQEALHFRAEVMAVAPGALPRFELKARRFVRLRR